MVNIKFNVIIYFLNHKTLILIFINRFYSIIVDNVFKYYNLWYKYIILWNIFKKYIIIFSKKITFRSLNASLVFGGKDALKYP
jgi:hypothetical protein